MTEAASWLGAGLGVQGSRGAQQARGHGAGKRQARASAGSGSKQGARGAQEARAQGALGSRAGQGCALGALGLFLVRFDSVLFLSQIFGHCSRTRFMNTVHHKKFRFFFKFK